uniref:PH domain-containing protein n=1 Tax=Macrostomum lignano TaxID=282301 RepID=A0A1I8JAW7_9PLAT
MEDTASLEDSSMTIVQAADSTIAFAYIKEVQAKKKRFFVLKSQPRRSSLTNDFESGKSTLNLPPRYFLYAYKNKKCYERGEPKRVYDLANVILLSRSTKKANQTILGVCLQDEALYLEFDTEDELSRWYFHLNEIFSAQRNCLWPELKQCVNAEQSSPFKELVEHLVRCLYETGSRDLEIVKSRKNRRNSRQTSSTVSGSTADDYQAQRPASVHCINQRTACAHCAARASVLSAAQMKPSQSSSGLGSDGSCSGSRGLSLPPPDCQSQCSSAQQQQQQQEDYCLMEMSTGSNDVGGTGGIAFRGRSPNSSMSLSTTSEVTGVGGGGDSERGPSAVSTGHRGFGPADEQLQHHQHHQGSPISRANSIGCRPQSRGGLFSQYPVVHHPHHSQQQQQQQRSPHMQSRSRFQHQHQHHHRNSSSHQVFAEQQGFSRPRTTSDAASLNASCANCGTSSGGLLRGFRPRAISYGNKFGRPAAQPADGEVLGVCDIASSSGASPSPSLALSSCMRPLSESTASSSGELAVPAAVSQQPSRLSADDEGSYVTMLLRPTRSCLRQNSYQQQRELDEHKGLNGDDDLDPYWTPPGRLDSLLGPGTSVEPPTVDSAAPLVGEVGGSEDYFMMDLGGATD